MGEKVVVDDGYGDLGTFKSKDLFKDSRKTFRRIRARHEGMNGHIKEFRVHCSRFRHN